jgi:hypothetical protein
MIRFIFTTLAVSLWATTSAPAASWAESLFDAPHHDFGSVPHGPTVTHHFHLTNTTGKPLHIAGVRVSCGCVTATALKTDVAPGQSADIQALMDTSRFFGFRKVTVFVQFDQPYGEEARLSVQANSRNDVTFTPEALAFGRVKKGGGAETSVNVSFVGNSDWQILEAKGDSGYIQTSVQEVRRDASEVTYQVTARLRPDTPIGTWYTDVWVKTNNPALPQVRVPLTVQIDPALSISPTVAALGQVKAGTEAERKIIVRGDKPFRITKVKGTDAQLSVQDSASDNKPVHVLTVKLKAASAGQLARTIKISTDLQDSGDIEFEATAQVVP